LLDFAKESLFVTLGLVPSIEVFSFVKADR